MLTRNRPQEGCDLARYRGDGGRRLLAIGSQPPLASTQASLCLPGNFPNLLRQLCHPCLVNFADPCRVPVGLRGFDQCLAGADVARLGDPALLARIPVERSDGTRPRNTINWRRCSNRRMSPASATMVVAVTSPTPRIAWNAATTGAIVHAGTISSNAASSRSIRSAKQIPPA
jgi:hypothetical protein